MDAQHLRDLNPDCGSNAVRCLICLSTFGGQPVASPQHCNHLYCLACITQWAKTTNSCPVDRLKFTVLYQRSCVGKAVEKIITVEPHDPEGSEEEGTPEELSVCEECGTSDRRHLMLVCSRCDSRFHIACLSPPLAAVPIEDWFCLECAAEASHAMNSSSREESEVTEAEVLDLLSEVIPTSSRLRPSTAVSVRMRRSERIRQQSSRMPTTRSLNVQHVPRYLLKSSFSEDATTSNFLLNTQKADKTSKVPSKETRRQKTDRLDSV